MRIMKWVLATLLGVLLLADAIVALRLVRYGWPKHLVGTVDDPTAQFLVVPIRMDATAWVSLVLYTVVHFVLCYGLWRLWRHGQECSVPH